MPGVCDRCGAWIPSGDSDWPRGRGICAGCGQPWSEVRLPLFVLTGASGTGKSTLVPVLRRRLPSWDVFETDVLWDSGGDWQMVKGNWLRIAHGLHQSRRPVMLCGSMTWDELDRAGADGCVARIHWLALWSTPEAQAARLRARPAWRGADAAEIARQIEYNAFFRGAFDSGEGPLRELLDTSDRHPQALAEHIAAWAEGHWAQALSA